jgi:protein-tyrosine phosphatase
MSRPRGGDWLEDEIQSWRRAGVDGVVSLLTSDEVVDLGLTDEGKLCLANGIQFDSFPIPDRGVPPSKEEFSQLLTRLAEQLAGGKTIAIHCRQGIGRAPLVAIGLLMRTGISPDAAVRQVSAARGCPVPETLEQSRWISAVIGGTALRAVS